MSDTDKPQLKVLVRELTSVAYEWYDIGLQLDFEDGELKNIKADSQPVKERLREMLSMWLKRVDPAPTWAALVEALKALPDTAKLGSKLGKEYCPTIASKECHSLSLSSSITTVSSNPLSPNASITSSLSSPTSPVFSQGMSSGPLVVERSEDKLRTDFTAMLSRMSKKLIEMNTELNSLYRHLSSLFASASLFSTPFDESKFKDPMDIFVALQRHQLITHLHYNPPLESIGPEFGTSESDQFSLEAMVKDYDLKLEAFLATTKLADYISKCETEEEADPDEPLDKTYDAAFFKKLRLKLNTKIRNKTLKYIDDLWRYLADKFQLPPLSALLDTVIAGSLIIVWRVHHLIIEQILERISDASEFFRSHEILEVFVDDECVYKDSEHVDMGESDHTLPRRLDEPSRGPLSEYLMDPESETPEEHADDETTQEIQPTRPTILKRFTNFMRSGLSWAQVGVLNVKLIWAARRGNAESVQELLKNGAEPNCKEKDPYRWTPLMWASHNGHANVVKVLLLNGADPNVRATGNWSALILASRNGHHEAVKLLLGNGALVNEKNKFGWNALMWASQCRDYYGARISTDPKKKENLKRVCVYLLGHGADPNVEAKNGWTPVMQASQDGHAEFVKLLAESHADLDHLEKKEETFALMVAATKGHTEVVETLAQCKADLNRRNKKNQAAIHIACYKGHKEIVEKFIKYKADLEIKDKMGLTPLMIATKSGNKEITKMLSETKGIDVNSQAEKYANWTPLMFAAKNGDCDSVKILLENGARADIKDSNGQSVVGIAKTFNHWPKIKKLLLERTRVAEASSETMEMVRLSSLIKSAQLEVTEPLEETTTVQPTSDGDQETARAEPDPVEIKLGPTLSFPMFKEGYTVPSAKQELDQDTIKRQNLVKFLTEEERRYSRPVDSDSYKSCEVEYKRMMLPTIAAAAA